MNTQRFTLSSLFAVLVLATNLAYAEDPLSIQMRNHLESEAKVANEAQNIRAKAFAVPVQPEGTQFLITATYPTSNWQVSNFQGSVLTAVACDDESNTTGIHLITAGERKDWFEACFTKADSPARYYVYGFQYALANDAVDQFDEASGKLTLPAVKVGADLYSAVLRFEDNNLFLLQSAGPRTGAPLANVVDNFDAKTGELTLPSVKVGMERYAAVLRLEESRYFRLLSAIKL